MIHMLKKYSRIVEIEKREKTLNHRSILVGNNVKVFLKSGQNTEFI